MSNQYVGELRLVAFNFAPVGWAEAAGQLLPIAQYTAVFSLLGTFYGGDGRSTFALPNMQGNVAIGQGQALGGSQYFIGEVSGSQNVTLLDGEAPQHNHTFSAASLHADIVNPSAVAVATTPAGTSIYAPTGGTKVALNTQMLSTFGGSQPHNNMMPYLTLNWLIALQGVFPPRS
ncbi:MAG TPA: tail fiber protein [Terracidiphilus sp.]|jgi:microcystin-dependent protein|nr:tail fiber protein [Terracidiphilus sp.]